MSGKIENIELAGIDMNDYPDFCDAYIVSATIDGKQMTSQQIDEINENSDFVYKCVMNYLY